MEEVGDNLILSLFAVARFKDSNPSIWEEPSPYKQKQQEDFQSSKVIISLSHFGYAHWRTQSFQGLTNSL